MHLIKVRQFFKCFPEDKVPFLNSIGEKYRLVCLIVLLLINSFSFFHRECLKNNYPHMIPIRNIVVH